MNEAEIRAEVEKRKQRARDLRLDQIVFQLWHDHLKYLEENFDHEKCCMPKSLTKVVTRRQIASWDSKESVDLYLGDTCFTFAFEEHNTTMPDGDIWTSGHILVSCDANTVFDLHCTCTEDRWMGREWHPSEIEGFIEGPWVDQVKKFAQQVFSLYGQSQSRFKQEREENELRRLKSKFGI